MHTEVDPKTSGTQDRKRSSSKTSNFSATKSQKGSSGGLSSAKKSQIGVDATPNSRHTRRQLTGSAHKSPAPKFKNHRACNYEGYSEKSSPYRQAFGSTMSKYSQKKSIYSPQTQLLKTPQRGAQSSKIDSSKNMYELLVQKQKQISIEKYERLTLNSMSKNIGAPEESSAYKSAAEKFQQQKSPSQSPVRHDFSLDHGKSLNESTTSIQRKTRKSRVNRLSRASR